MEKNKYEPFYEKYQKKLKEQYPSVSHATLHRRNFEHSALLKHEYSNNRNKQKSEFSDQKNISAPPVSPFLITLSRNKVNQISNLVKLFYKIAHSKTYIKNIQTDKDFYLNTSVSDSAVLMSYDFHIDHKGSLKLIEVNTNSSGYLVSNLVDQIQGLDYHTPPQKNQAGEMQIEQAKRENKQNALLLLRKSFEAEWQNFSEQCAFPSEILIVDRQIKTQKMYIEFLMYKDLLERWGWPCRLQEIESLNINSQGELIDSHQKPVKMLYNRSTDFYFESLPYLKEAFLKQKCCISPHPREYVLLADKKRLCEWSSEDFLSQLNISPEEKTQIRNAVPFTAPVNSIPAQELWEKRKKIFFKPLRGYGGKSVYRGKSISRKVFARIITEPGVFQEVAPPAVFIDPSGEKWKYDIRAYVYKDQVQKLSARVYQGQLTQFQKPLSGFASITVQ